MKTPNQRPLLTVVLACLLLLPTSGRAADLFNIATTKSTTSPALMWIAKDKGYFAEQNLDVRTIDFDPPQMGIAAVINGEIDLYGTSLNASIYNTAGNGDLVIIAGYMSEHAGFHAQAAIASAAAYAAGITSPRDFNGLRVGMGVMGSSYQYSLILLGQKYGFPTPNSQVLTLGAQGNILAALKTGAIKVAMVPGAIATGAQDDGQGRIVAWIGDETPYAYQAIFVNRRTASARRNETVRFLSALLLAARLYDQTFQQRNARGEIAFGPQADELVAIIAKGSGLDAPAVRQAIGYLDPTLSIDAADISRQVGNWQAVGMVDKTVDAAKFIDPSLLDQARLHP